MVVRQLAAIGPVLAQNDRQIGEVITAHPDAPIFASLPGAGLIFARGSSPCWAAGASGWVSAWNYNWR